MATPGLDEKSLLLSSRLENIGTDSVCFFYVNDCFDRSSNPVFASPVPSST